MSQNSVSVKQTRSLKKQSNSILITSIGINHLHISENKMRLMEFDTVKKSAEIYKLY